MPIRISCDECPFTTNVQDAYAGKRVKCPKCQSVIQVPVPARETEGVGDDEPVARPNTKAKPRVVVNDEDDAPRPKPKKKPVVLEEDDEDDVPRPKKRKDRRNEKQSEGGKSRVWLFVGIGAAVLLLGGVGIFLATRGKTPEVAVNQPRQNIGGETTSPKANPTPTPDNNPLPQPKEPPRKDPPPPVLKPRVQFPLEVQHPVLAWAYISPDGSQAVLTSAGNLNQPCYIWDLADKPKTARQLRSVYDVLPGFKCYRRDFPSKPGFELVDLSSGGVAATCTERYDHVAAQSDSVFTLIQTNYLESTADGGQRNIMRVAEWNTRDKTPVEKFRFSLSEGLEFYGFANKGKQVVFGKGSTGLVRILNVSTGKVDRELTIPKQDKNRIAFDGLSISEDGKRLVLRDSPFTPQRVLDATTGERLDTLPKGTQNTAKFLGNGDLVLCWMSDFSFRGWAVYDLKEKAIRALLPAQVLTHVLSQDGKTLLTWKFTANTTELEVWDLPEANK